jgi:hypothetical protein
MADDRRRQHPLALRDEGDAVRIRLEARNRRQR